MTAKDRLFVRNHESGEPAYYCGTVDEDAAEGALNICRPEIEVFLSERIAGDTLSLEFTIQPMTDQEVEALPDI